MAKNSSNKAAIPLNGSISGYGKKKEDPKQVQPFESHVDRIVQLVVEKLKPEISLLQTNLKKENQNELRQLRFEIEKLRPPAKQTAGIMNPKERGGKVNPKDLMQDPAVQNILNQFKTLQGLAPAANSTPNTLNAPQPVQPQTNGLGVLLELIKGLSGGGGFGGGGNSMMNEMMMRNWLAQQNRQTFLYDKLTEHLIKKFGATETEIATMNKTNDALMNPLKTHGEKLEAASKNK